MNFPIFCVDAFTNRCFGGNPAGVCLLQKPVSATWMQSIASEMNLSETAFLLPKKNGYSLRWFTPKNEVDLCGHATLATAHILWETKRSSKNHPIQFSTKSGLLVAKHTKDGIQVDFPAYSLRRIPVPNSLKKSLKHNLKKAFNTGRDILIEFPDEETVLGLKPDFAVMKTVPTLGVIATARSRNPKYDFISRFFAPSVGIDEDPVTGSAHCALGPYWQTVLHKSKFKAYQASKRGGELIVEVSGGRVFLTGKAITVWHGQLK